MSASEILEACSVDAWHFQFRRVMSVVLVGLSACLA